MRKVKSILSIVLVLCMLFSTFTVVFAEEAGTPGQDSNAPVIDLSTLEISDEDGSIERGDTVRVRVKVTDESDINSISVIYKCNGADNGAGASYYYSNDFDVNLYNKETQYFEADVRFYGEMGQAYYGLYEIDSIMATDAYGNDVAMTRYSYGSQLDAGTFRVTGGVADDTAAPVIDHENITITKNVAAGNKAKITVPISDASEIYSVQVEYGSANTSSTEAVSLATLTLNEETGLFEGEIEFNYFGENNLIDILAVDANRNETRFINTAYPFPRDFVNGVLTTTVQADASNADVYYGDPDSVDTEKPVVDLGSITLEKRVLEKDENASLTLRISDSSALKDVSLSFVHARHNLPSHVGPTSNEDGVYTFHLPSSMYGQWKLARVEVIDTYGNTTAYQDSRIYNYSADLPDTDLSAGNYYVGVIDTTTGVSVSDESLSDNTSLSVTQNQLSGTVYDQMLEENCTAHAFYDVSVSGDRASETALLIPAPTNLSEGDAVRVVHLKADGTTENLDTTVKNGLVAVTVSEFSPFLLETGFTPAVSNPTVTFSANGVPFMITNPTENGGSETGMCGGDTTHTVEAGKKLSEAGIKVWHEGEHEPHFLGWKIMNMNPNTGNWEEALDNDGNPILLDTNSLNNSFIINNDVRFVPQWTSYNVIFEGYNGGTFDFSLTGLPVQEDIPSAAFLTAYMRTLNDGTIAISDIKNGNETFYGWDVYQRVEDANNPGMYNLIPLVGPIDTQDVLSRSITHDVVYRVNWTGEAIGGNQGPSTDPDHNLIISSNNGSPFTLRLADGTDSQFMGYFGTIVGSGVTNLSGMGFTAIELDSSTPFVGWSVYYPVRDNNNAIIDWQPVTDSTGNAAVLKNANDILNYPINDGVKFEAEWNTGSSTTPLVNFAADPVTQIELTDKDGNVSSGMQLVHFDVQLGQTPYAAGLRNVVATSVAADIIYGWDIMVQQGTTPEKTLVESCVPLERVLNYVINAPTTFAANYVNPNPNPNPGGGAGDGGPGTPMVYTMLSIYANGGTFDIYRANPQNGQVEKWADDVDNTREDAYSGLVPGKTLADCGITDITDLKYWDGKRAFLGWQAYGMVTVTDEGGSYQMWGPLSDKVYTTKEMLAYPAVEGDVEFIAVWDGDEEDYWSQVVFDAMGGTFQMKQYDEDGLLVDTWTTGNVGNSCKQNGETWFEQWSSVVASDPVHEDYTFEGWLIYSHAGYMHEMSDKLYTTEQIMKLPIPEDDVTYIAKWKEISMEEYRFGNPYAPYEGQYAELYTLANGGKFNITVSFGENKDTYTDTRVFHYTEGDMTFEEYFKEFAIADLSFELADKTNFEGWTTYEADRIYSVEIRKGDKLTPPEGNFTILYVGENEYDAESGEPIYTESYLLLKNAKVYSKTMTPQEAQKLSGKFYAILATWHKESPNLANVKSATHTEEGYTGDVVCANCGEILEKGKVIEKIKETVSIPVINQESKTSVDNQIGTLVAVISGDKTEETKTVLSEGTKEAIKEAVTSGHVVGADIVIEPIAQDKLTGTALETFKKESAAIANKAAEKIGGHAVVAEFIDISVIVKNRTTGEKLGNITELDKPVAIEFRVPVALQAENRDYFIIHYHDGAADLIDGDYKDGILLISADKFSTYALVYADTTPPSVPATGDESHLMFFTTMLLIAAAGVYLTSRKLRRA